MKKYIAIIIALLGITASVLAGDTNSVTAVHGHKTIWGNGVKSYGFIGSHEVAVIHTGGLLHPGQSITVLVNKDDSVVPLSSGANAGIAGEVVAGSAQAGAAYLFGSSIRPETTSVNNGSASASTSTANGGSGTVTGGTTTVTGGKTHPDSPGNGGVPGNGHGHAK
jgi:hypothetical protein